MPCRFNPQPPRRTAATLAVPIQTNLFTRCFNPQPPRRTAATREAVRPRPRLRWFQSSAAPKDGCYPTLAAACFAAAAFQSSAAPKDGCYPVRLAEVTRYDLVSILSRPEGRLLHDAASAGVHRRDPVSILSRPEGRLLPPAHPSLHHPLQRVSILSRPEGRLLPTRAMADGGLPTAVSILSRPEGRLLQPASSTSSALSAGFNPQPPRRTAATPLPVVRLPEVVLVSILSRPEGRLLRAPELALTYSHG